MKYAQEKKSRKKGNSKKSQPTDEEFEKLQKTLFNAVDKENPVPKKVKLTEVEDIRIDAKKSKASESNRKSKRNAGNGE